MASMARRKKVDTKIVEAFVVAFKAALNEKSDDKILAVVKKDCRIVLAAVDRYLASRKQSREFHAARRAKILVVDEEEVF